MLLWGFFDFLFLLPVLQDVKPHLVAWYIVGKASFKSNKVLLPYFRWSLHNITITIPSLRYHPELDESLLFCYIWMQWKQTNHNFSQNLMNQALYEIFSLFRNVNYSRTLAFSVWRLPLEGEEKGTSITNELRKEFYLLHFICKITWYHTVTKHLTVKLQFQPFLKVTFF